MLGSERSRVRASAPEESSTSMNLCRRTGSKWRSACSSIISTAFSTEKAPTVDAVGGEGIEYVRDRHDAALDRNVLGGEAARIAVAVPALVVGEGDRGTHVEDRGGGAAQQAVALLGVGLYDRALLGGQRAGLEQDRVGDRHLADVVQGRGVADASAELGAHPDRFGQQRGEASDALDVGTGVLVAKLDRHREATDRLGLGDLQL